MSNPDAAPRVVIDSDTANEIDDQFAIAWALLAGDRLRVEGVHAAPFSHGVFLQALARACAGRGAATPLERIARAIPKDELEALVARTAPGAGMERSHAEILRVFEACGVEPSGRVKRGSGHFMQAPDAPVPSDAVDHLLALAATATPAEPLYVATIGAPTNVASALLTEPELAERIVVLFLAGYPSGAGLADDSFNLVQDRFASNVLLESRVPLVYMPGYQVAQLLQLSLPDAKAWLAGRGRLGDFLYETYSKNPLSPDKEEPGRSWILWDMIATAWLLSREWVPTRDVPRARIDEEHCWHPLDASAGTMQEAYRVDRDRVFVDFLERLGAAA